MRKLFLLLIWTLACGTVSAQVSRTFSGSDDQSVRSFQVCRNYGFIVAGATEESAGSTWLTDVLLVRLNSTGAKTWVRTYDFSGADSATWVDTTSDGGIIVTGTTGYTHPNMGDRDIFLMKLDSHGVMEWRRVIGRPNPYIEASRYVEECRDGGYIIAGYSNVGCNGPSHYDGLLIKTDENGNTLWQRGYGNANYNAFYSATELRDGGFAATGSSFATASSGIWLVRVDGAGAPMFDKTFLTNGSFGWCIREAVIGTDLLVCGRWDAGSQSMLARFDRTCTPIWCKSYLPSVGGHNEMMSMRENAAGTAISMIGWIQEAAPKAFLIETTTLGVVTDKRRYASTVPGATFTQGWDLRYRAGNYFFLSVARNPLASHVMEGTLNERVPGGEMCDLHTVDLVTTVQPLSESATCFPINPLPYANWPLQVDSSVVGEVDILCTYGPEGPPDEPGDGLIDRQDNSESHGVKAMYQVRRGESVMFGVLASADSIALIDVNGRRMTSGFSLSKSPEIVLSAHALASGRYQVIDESTGRMLTTIVVVD